MDKVIRYRYSHTQHAMYDIKTMRIDQHDYTFVKAEDYDDLKKQFVVLFAERAFESAWGDR